MATELKKCPFCGGSAVRGQVTVECMDCGAGTGAGRTAAVIAAWNRRASGWVPVSERLPDFHVPVLVYAEGGSLMVCERFDPGDESGWFWKLRTSPSGFASPRGVTHWQPIAHPSPAVEPATKEGEGDE